MIYDTVYGSDGTSTAEIGNGMKDAVPVPRYGTHPFFGLEWRSPPPP